MFRTNLLLLFFVIASVFAGLASGGHRNGQDNISTWYLFMNNNELTSSRVWNTRDTAAYISLYTNELTRQDTVRFRFVFDVFGLRYHTYLYLANPGGEKELVSDQVSDDVATGQFAAQQLQQVADRLHSSTLQFLCRIDKGPAVRLINIKLENGK